MREKYLRDPEVRREYEQEVLFGEATDTVAGLLESLGISQRELSQRLGVSESRVSQIINGNENLTLRTLADLGWALGIRFELDPVPMANRAGTPAEGDPPTPAWVTRLRDEQPVVEFGYVPPPVHQQPRRVAWQRVEATPDRELALAA